MLDKNSVKIGIAPIAWTNDDMPELGGENTFEQCVSEIALAGFAGTEVGSRFPKDPTALKKALSLRGIRICNQWFSSFLLTQPFETVEKAARAQMSFLREAGAGIIGFSEQSYSVQGRLDVPIFGHKHTMDGGEWKRLTQGLNRLGRIAKEEYGIALTYHHHMGTVVQSDWETERLMNETDPAYLSLLYDSGHFAYAGEDPAAMAEKYASRIRHVHLKDIRPAVVARVRAENRSFLDGVRLGTFTVPGDGCIDFDAVFAALDAAGYRGWMVVEAEQDPAKANPLEYALRAREFLAEKTGI